MSVLSRRTYLLSLLFALPFALTLLSYAALGSNSRVIADDYCTAADGVTYGVSGSVQHYYETWSGAHAAYAIYALLAPFQPELHTFLTGLHLSVWWLALVWLIYEMAIITGVEQKVLPASLVATVGLYAIVSTAPSDEALYWFASLLGYTLPCILIVVYACLILLLLRQTPSPAIHLIGVIASSVIGFFNAGIAETTAVFQLLALALALVATWFWLPASPRRNTALLLLSVGLLASGLSLLLNLIAPGNDIRAAAVAEAKEFTSGNIFLPLLILLAYAFAVQETITLPAVLASASVFFTAAYLTWRFLLAENSRPWRHIQRYFNLSIPVAYTIAAVVIAVPLYGVAHPSPRSLMVIRLWQMVVVAWWGWIAGQTMLRRGKLQGRIRAWIAKRWPVIVVVVVMMLTPLNTLRENLLLWPDFSAYAAAWDARHEQIRAAATAGQTSVEISLQPTFLEDYLKLDNLNVWQECAERFYGIALKIRGTDTVDSNE